MILKLYLLLVQIYVNAIENIYWEIQSDPVVFGESVTLYCNTSSVQDKCEECTRRWYGGATLDLLSFNGLTVNHFKYETSEDRDGFSLIIKHFDESDVNKLYSCTFGFFFDKKKLQLTSDFEIQPMNETTDIIQYVDSGSMFNIKVDFKKVYPPPRCAIFLSGDNLSSKLITKQHQVGIFYRVTVEFQHILKPNHCMCKIQLDCTIGTRNLTVFSSNISDNIVQQSLGPPWYAVGSIILVIIICGVTMVVLKSKLKTLLQKHCWSPQTLISSLQSTVFGMYTPANQSGSNIKEEMQL